MSGEVRRICCWEQCSLILQVTVTVVRNGRGAPIVLGGNTIGIACSIGPGIVVTLSAPGMDRAGSSVSVLMRFGGNEDTSPARA